MVTKNDTGNVVRYYNDGWYFGVLEKVTKKEAQVRPIVSKYQKKPHLIHLSLEDVYSEENG